MADWVILGLNEQYRLLDVFENTFATQLFVIGF